MYCKFCKIYYDETLKYCSKCGAELSHRKKPDKSKKKKVNKISKEIVEKLKKKGIYRAISIRQPYVEQILRGIKPIEYRSRKTNIRERVYLYASLTPEP